MRGDIGSFLCALLVLPLTVVSEDLNDEEEAPAVATRRTTSRYTFELEHDISGTGEQFTRRNEVSYEGNVEMVSAKRGSRPTLKMSKFSFSQDEVNAIEVRLFICVLRCEMGTSACWRERLKYCNAEARPVWWSVQDSRASLNIRGEHRH